MIRPVRLNPRPQNKYTWEAEEIPHSGGIERIWRLRENDRAPSTGRNGYVEWDVHVIHEDFPRLTRFEGGGQIMVHAPYKQDAVRDLEEAGIGFSGANWGPLIVPMPGDVHSGEHLMQRTEHKSVEAAKKHALAAFVALKNKIEQR